MTLRSRLAPTLWLSGPETQENAVPCGVVETGSGKVRHIGSTGQENAATALLPFKIASAFRRPLPRLAALAAPLCPCLRCIRELIMQAATLPLIGSAAAPFAALRPV